MSSLFRFSIIMVLVLATVALGFIAYTANQPKPVALAPTMEQKAPDAPTPKYYFAKRELTTGTFLRAGDFENRPGHDEVRCHALSNEVLLPDEDLSGEEIRESRDLLGSLVVKYVEAGCPITRNGFVRPRERGFLASVLGKGARAISLNVDIESGVAGLIWPGDHVDVVLTQTGDKDDRALHSLSEIVLHNVRIIAIDQDVVQGDPVANTAVGKIVEGAVGANAEPRKVARSVSLELSPEQVKKIALAKDLGKLSLAVRSAEEVRVAADSGAPLAVKLANDRDADDSGATFGRDVSPSIGRQQDAEIARENAEIARKAAEVACQNAIARQFTTVVVYAKGKHSAYTVRKQRMEDAERASGCAGYREMAPASAALAGADDEKAKE